MSQAISGTRRAIKELVDGTVRVQIDIDPEYRREFFRLFPDIDTRVAIAPLLGSAQAQQTTGSPKGGDLARLAGILCADPDFQLWVEEQQGADSAAGLEGEERAAQIVRHVCGVKSRAELDHNAHAAERFHELIRKPWMAA